MNDETQTMSSFNSPREFAAFTRTAVLAGPWNQAVVSAPAGAHHTAYCDVGTKLAAAFGRVYIPDDLRLERRHLSRDGREAACEALGLSLQELKDLFWLCGASRLYLTGKDLNGSGPVRHWPVSRATVWNRLALLDTMPSFDTPRRVRERTAATVEANWRFWRDQYGVDVREPMRNQDRRVARIEVFWQQLTHHLNQPN